MPVGAAIGGAAVIGGATTVIAGNKAAGAARDGAETAAEASERGTKLQVEEARRQYDLTREDYQPARLAGNAALSRLQEMYGLPATYTTSDVGGKQTPVDLSLGWGSGSDAYKDIALRAPQGIDWEAYVKGNSDAMSQWAAQGPDLASFGGDLRKFGSFHYVNDGARRDLAPFKATAAAPTTTTTTAPGSATTNGIPGPDYSDIGTAPDYSGFETSPGYQFRLKQGMDAVRAGASARGNLGSTATMKNITRFAEGTAAQEYDTFYNRRTAAHDASYNRRTAAYDAYANRLAAMAGVGQTATAGTAAAGQASTGAITTALGNNAQVQGNAAIAGGNARASAYQNVGSGINQTATGLAAAYLKTQQPDWGSMPRWSY